jgi:hypothetical protein
MDMGMLEKGYFNYGIALRMEIKFYLGFVKQLFVLN